MTGSGNRLLLVETDAGFRYLLEQVARAVADVQIACDFAEARAALLAGGFDLLATNLRLRAHNGLHLVHLMRAAAVTTRAVVYTDQADLGLAIEAQRATAFYEQMIRLPFSLGGYLRIDLPESDRRNPLVVDRRTWYRGGRRRSDVPLSSVSPFDEGYQLLLKRLRTPAES
jgi:CheY-like chemotaxis protein